MHIKRVEEYSFSHGLHRDNLTGKFLPLQPHQFGRPLTHDEMDYNMRYMEQTLGGYKIFGSNQDTTLSEDDLDKSLILHRITPVDDDYARYTDGDYFLDNEFIWIPACCGDSSSGDSCDITVTADFPGQATPGQNDVNLIVYVSGLNGQPTFEINGVAATADAVNGPQYTFNGYGAGTYTIVVTDSGITEYVCDDTVVVTVTETANECLGFAVSIATQDSGGEEDPVTCELTDLVFVSSVTNIPFGSSSGEVVLRVEGSWTGPLQFTFNGTVTTWDSVNGNEYTFIGLSADTYNVYVIDTAIVSNTCTEFVQFEIAEGTNPCLDFAVSTTTQDSGAEAENPCLTFAVSTGTQDSGADSNTNVICQEFTINNLQVELGPNDAATGNIIMTLNTEDDQGNALTWGSLTIDYTTEHDPFDGSVIWTNVPSIQNLPDGTYELSGLPYGWIWIRVVESNDDCMDTENVFSMTPTP